MPRNLAPDIEQHRADVLAYIDQQAGVTRAAFVSPGALIEDEYRQALRAVEQWRDAGSPAHDTPDEIVSGAEYSGITPEQAAQEIETTAAQFDAVLAAIRQVRLSHKAAVKAATTAAEIAQARIGTDAAYAQIIA